MKPKRIQRKRTKDWRMPPNTVYVGRPSKWGNPFTGPDAVDKYRKAVFDDTYSSSIEREWIDAGGSCFMLMNLQHKNPHTLIELRGKNLACWCPMDKPCHADILLEIVNQGGE